MAEIPRRYQEQAHTRLLTQAQTTKDRLGATNVAAIPSKAMRRRVLTNYATAELTLEATISSRGMQVTRDGSQAIVTTDLRTKGHVVITIPDQDQGTPTVSTEGAEISPQQFNILTRRAAVAVARYNLARELWATDGRPES